MFPQDENLLNTHYGADEIEMLQTDIQRFLAILAFCLLPIFMLVQSIPVVGQEKDAVIERLGSRVENQNQDLDRLRIENGELTEKMSRLMRLAGISDRMKAELDKALERIDQQRKQIEALIHEKLEEQDDPTALKRQLVERDQKIRKLIREKDQFKRLLEQTAKEIKAFAQKDLKPGSDTQTVKEEKGLYVAFESDRVFLDLLEARKVQLFIHVTGVKQSFRVTGRAGSILFDPGVPPEDLDLWEIKEVMVPGEILDAFRKWTTLASREMMFIVGLSPELFRQIREKGAQGGRILIGEEGKIHLEAHGG